MDLPRTKMKIPSLSQSKIVKKTQKRMRKYLKCFTVSKKSTIIAEKIIINN